MNILGIPFSFLRLGAPLAENPIYISLASIEASERLVQADRGAAASAVIPETRKK